MTLEKEVLILVNISLEQNKIFILYEDEESGKIQVKFTKSEKKRSYELARSL